MIIPTTQLLRGTRLIHRRKAPAGLIGIDLGTRSIKIAQVSLGTSELSRIELQGTDLPVDTLRDWRAHTDEIVSGVRRLLGSGAFVGRQVASCLPHSLLEYRNMRLEPTARADLHATVHARCTADLGFPSDQYKTQFFDAGEVWEGDEKRIEVIALAAPRSGIHDYLRILTRCGVVPVALDAAPAAMARALDCQLIVDIGYEWTSVVMTHRSRVRFVRRIEFGMHGCDEMAARLLRQSREQAESMRDFLAGSNAHDARWPFSAVDRETAEKALVSAQEQQGARLAREVSKCLQYHDVTFRTPRMVSGLVVGGGAHALHMVQALTRGCGVDFRTVESSRDTTWVALASAAASSGTVGRWTVATGLSMYGASNPAERDAA